MADEGEADIARVQAEQAQAARAGQPILPE
jgi:hypothetical protein